MKGNAYDQNIRLPDLLETALDVLKDEMTTICDNYQINESDLMRKAIVQFVQNINANPERTSWKIDVRLIRGNIRIPWISLGYYIPIRPLSFPLCCRGLFRGYRTI